MVPVLYQHHLTVEGPSSGKSGDLPMSGVAQTRYQQTAFTSNDSTPSEEEKVNEILKLIVARARQLAGKDGLKDRVKIAEWELAYDQSQSGVATVVLAEALVPMLLKLASRIEADAPSSTFGSDQAHCVDLLLAELVEPLGEHGAAYATQIREGVERHAELSSPPSARERWHKWADDIEVEVPRFTLSLAWALWNDVVAPKMRGVLVPAISYDVLTKAAGAYWSPGRRVSGPGLIVSPRGISLAQFPAAVDADRAERLIKAGPRLTAHRLFRFIVSEVYRQSATGKRDPRRIVVLHGLVELAGRLGMDSSKTSQELRDALDLFQAAQLQLPHGATGGLLSWELTPPAPGRLARIDINVSSALGASYVFGLPKHLPERQLARRLVPIPLELPPLIGSPNLHGAQATLQLLVLREFRDAAEAFANDGFVQIDTERWTELAAEAGLPPSRMSELLEAWTTGADGKPPMLVRVPGDTDRFDLAEHYSAERDLLIEGGKMSRLGRESQARSGRAHKAGQWRSKKRSGGEP